MPNSRANLPTEDNVKALKYPKIELLWADQRRLIGANYDDWNLCTARVGKGKSKWARKNCRKLDPTFGLDRIHFDEGEFWDQYKTLQPGQAIILDEFDGHRRAAMHGERLTFLERMKRVRSRRLHVWVIYDRVSNLDRDLLTDRNAFWHHLEIRGSVQVRQPSTKLRFKEDSTPIEPTTYPLVGDFDFTGWEPAGFEEAYDRKKDAYNDVFGDLGKEETPSWSRVNKALVDLAATELGLVKPGK